MSLSFPNFVLPTCVGWNFVKRSQYSSIIQRPQTMRRPASATMQQSVIYELELTFEFLKNQGITYPDDMGYVQSFYEACRGGFGWFTFDPSVLQLDCMSVVQDPTALRSGFFAMGDGVTTVFPLWRSTAALGDGRVTPVEMIQYVPFQPGIYVDGVLQPAVNYTLNNFPATVTFNNPPPPGVTLSWEGSYSYLCRFAEDSLELEEFAYQLWELKSLRLETINL
jgi:hypothetical protein